MGVQICFTAEETTQVKVLDIAREMDVSISSAIRHLISRGVKDYNKNKAYDNLSRADRDMVWNIIKKLKQQEG